MSVLNRMDTARKRDSTVATVSEHGLCIACRKDATCTYTRMLPIVQCEEFEGYEPRSKNLQSYEGPADPFPLPPSPAAEYKGLCTTCANRETCAFPKPVGGIWHCEEFR